MNTYGLFLFITKEAKYSLILLMIVLAVILACCIVMIWQHMRIRHTMKMLNRMLDAAIDGSFTEHNFDESLFSSVESRLNQYLTCSEVSARNLTTEKDKIKELIADISHQTKTPIANILLYTQLLEEQNLPAESMECVKALSGQAEKLSFLIMSLVKMSRLETGILTLNPVSNRVLPMLLEMKEQYVSKARNKGITLVVDSTDANGVFDLKWTTEALCNLVDNAVKYTPAGGKIHISVTVYEMFCRIDVADTGIGISEEEQAKIFTRFYRSLEAKDQEGVGIGLYLTRQILAEQGGYIKVASTLGEGAVFSMFIPRGA